MSTQPSQLHREALGLRDVIFQGITHIAPAINVVFLTSTHNSPGGCQPCKRPRSWVEVPGVELRILESMD